MKAQEEEIETDNGFIEAKSGEVFKFEAIGDYIEGVYILVEENEEFNNKVYTIDTEGGKKVVFGSTMLNSLMLEVPLQSSVKIELVGLKEHEKKNYHPIKQFRVLYKPSK